MATNFRQITHLAVFNALDGNVAGTTVYDHVPFEPEGAPSENFPFAVVGDTEAQAWDNDTTLGAELDVSIHVWSRYLGRKEANEKMDIIYGLLHRAVLTSAGYKFVDSLFLFSDVFVMDDGKTRHGIMRFRLTIQEA